MTFTPTTPGHGSQSILSSYASLSLERTGPSFRIALDALVQAHVAELTGLADASAEYQAKTRTLLVAPEGKRLPPISRPRTPRLHTPRNSSDQTQGMGTLPEQGQNSKEGIARNASNACTPRMAAESAIEPTDLPSSYKADEEAMQRKSKPLATTPRMGGETQRQSILQVYRTSAMMQNPKDAAEESNHMEADTSQELNVRKKQSKDKYSNVLEVWEQEHEKDAVLHDDEDSTSEENQRNGSPLAYEAILRGEASNGPAPTSLPGRLVRHPKFEGFFGMLIVLNTAAIALDTQYHGVDLGHNLGFPGFTMSAADQWPGMKEILAVMETAFGISFTVELVLKVIGLRIMFFKSPWNLFDAIIIVFWLLGQLVQANLVINPMILRLVRLGRLMRLVRLVRWVQALDALHILVRSIQASLSVLVWASLLIFSMIILSSLVVHHLSVSYLEDAEKPLEQRQIVFRYFGNFTRTTISFFEATLGNFGPIMRALTDNVDEFWGIVFMLYKCVGGFAVISVITGVFIKETFRVADNDPDLMVIKQRRQKNKYSAQMTRLFKAADRSGEGSLPYESFLSLMNDPFIKSWLSSCELDVHDVKLLWHLMDDGDGKLTADEFLTGVSRLKGFARSIDLQAMICASIDMHAVLADIHDLLDTLCDRKLRMNGIIAA